MSRHGRASPATSDRETRTPIPRPRVWPPMVMLTARELRRVWRQPSRVIATLGMGGLVWALLGGGFAQAAIQATGRSIDVGTGGYAGFMVPGIASMIAVFSAVFAGISLIEDRREGLLRGVLISPAPRACLVGAKVGSAAAIGLMQAALVLPAGLLVGLEPGAIGLALGIAACGLLTLGISGLSLALAWRVDSVSGFHGVMNLLLMPMWLLGGTIFPVSSSAGWMRPIMLINPLTWSTHAVRTSLDGQFHLWSWIGAAAFAASGVGLAWWHLTRPRGEPTG